MKVMIPMKQCIDSGTLNTDVRSLLAACRFVLMFDKTFTVGLPALISVEVVTDIFFAKCLLAFAFLEHVYRQHKRPLRCKQTFVSLHFYFVLSCEQLRSFRLMTAHLCSL